MLSKTDFDEIDRRTSKAISKAISDNNNHLFKVLATKEDLKNYVTKDDLQKQMDTLMSTMDKIYGVVKKIDQEQSVSSHTQSNHEIRLTKLEHAVA